MKFTRLIKNKKGQYMVEFGMLFIFFVILFLAVIEFSLFIHNIARTQKAVMFACRDAAIGKNDSQIKDRLYNEVQNILPTILLVCDFDQITITPPEISRVEGSTARVTVNFKTGFNLLWFQNFAFTIPMSTSMVVVAHNDEDRDYVRDDYDTQPNDHNNNGINETFETDSDGDSISNESDTCAITYDGTDYWITRSDGSAVNQILDKGWYHTREILNGYKADNPIYMHRFPPIIGYTLIIDSSFDTDNDGWEDKYDSSDTDPFVH